MVARIVGGIGSSHAPSIAHQYDKGDAAMSSPEWQPLFSGFQDAKEWLQARRPDVMVVIYNDHVDHLYFDAWPTFAIGVADSYAVADEGWGPRRFPAVQGHGRLGWHLARSLIADEFDMTICQQMSLDHGVLSPMPLFNLDQDWSVPIVPIAVNVILHPLPSPARCWKLGEALARGIASYPDDLRVVIAGTGGLSHQLAGREFGFVNPEWDREFMRLMTNDPRRIIEQYGHRDFIIRGGEHSVEVVNWLAMRGALPLEVIPGPSTYYPHQIMGYGIVTYAVPGVTNFEEGAYGNQNG